jgi:hypothetical protein
MATPYNKKGIFGNTTDFDVDLDGGYCGIIGGEMCDRDSVGPAWDWNPPSADVPCPSGGKVLGQLDHGEFHTAREGTRGK